MFCFFAGRNGYLTEEHKVVTEDGYILTLFRLSSGNCTEPSGTPVLFMHGLFEAADSLLDAGPGVAIPYLLADDCFDIWLGNNRGNMYGRAHISMNPDTDKDFWAFSVDEMGTYDLPAHIDFILNATKSETINYLGFSQGGGQVMITCSEKPQYNDKISLIFGLAPAARVRNTSSQMFIMLMNVVVVLKDFFASSGIYELFSKGGAVQSPLNYICGKNTTYEMCDEIIYLLDPSHLGVISPDTMRRIYSHFPSGVSVQLLSWYARGFSSDSFHKYDYGSDTENMAKYGSTTPPVYSLTDVTVLVVLTFGNNDTITTRADIEWLNNQLPNVLEIKEIEDPSWSHTDNLYNAKLTTLVYPTIKKYLAKYTTCL